jgi:predicted secreted protein
MPVFTAVAIFFVIWWVALFVVLPFGVRGQHEIGEIVPGTDPGAPVVPQIGRKLIWTTVVAAVIYGVCYLLYVNQLVTLEGMAHLFGMR